MHKHGQTRTVVGGRHPLYAKIHKFVSIRFY